MVAASSMGVDWSSSDLAVPLSVDLHVLARVTLHDACLNDEVDVGSSTARCASCLAG